MVMSGHETLPYASKQAPQFHDNPHNNLTVAQQYQKFQLQYTEPLLLSHKWIQAILTLGGVVLESIFSSHIAQSCSRLPAQDLVTKVGYRPQ